MPTPNTNLGGCYDSGPRCEQDFPEAVKWYRKAAEQGIADSTMESWFVCYYLGKGVPQDYTEA